MDGEEVSHRERVRLRDTPPGFVDSTPSSATRREISLLESGASNEIRWQRGERFHMLFEGRVDRLMAVGLAEHPAVDGPDGAVSYAELECWANRLARHLLAQGIRPRDRIGLLFERCWWSYAAMLAVSKAGAAFVPLDPAFPAERLAFIQEDASIRLILTTSDVASHVAGLPCASLCVDDEASEIVLQAPTRPAALPRANAADALCYIIYTSGSTGKPKGVAVAHSSVCNFLQVAGQVYGVLPNDRMYQGLTIAFDFSIEEIWIPLISGATLVPRPPGGALLGRDLADFLVARDVTALCCVPTMLATIDDDLPALRFLLVSGEACPHHLVQRWHRAGRRFLNVYGPTEATVTATWGEPRPDRPVTIGRPLPTYRIVILDESGRSAVAPGQTGEIAIAGPGLALGYVNRKDLTRKAFVRDFLGLADNPSRRLYRTGDLGRINAEGEVEYLGRIDDQVKIRGYRIELAEIESVLMTVPGIAAVVVSLWESAPGASELVAYYTSAGDIDIAHCMAILRARLPPYMVPSFLERLPSLPMLPSDKVDRKRLPAPSGRRIAASQPSREIREPMTGAQALLADKLRRLLEIDQVSIDDHFFDDLGSNSLMMARYCAVLRQERLFATVSMRDIYTCPTIRLLSEALDTAETSDRAETPKREIWRASDRDFVLTGLLQFLAYCAVTFVVGVVLVEGFAWIHHSDTWGVAYRRAALFGGGLFVLQAMLPVIFKWGMIGRWEAGTIPVWTPGYVRFWIVRSLLAVSPMRFFAGSPVYKGYLRLLGSRIGRGAVIFSDLPVCTDLISIGDGSIVRKDTLVKGYRAVGGVLELGTVDIGRNAFIGEACVLDIGCRVGDGAQVGYSSSLQTGQAVPAGARVQGSPAQPTGVDFVSLTPMPRSRAREAAYTIFQLAAIFAVAIPSAIVLTELAVTWLFVHNNPHAEGYGDFHIGPSGLHLDLLLFSALLNLTWLFAILAVIGTVPRMLGPFLRPDTPYPLFGLRYVCYQVASAASNSRTLNHLLGDSPYITAFLSFVGYAMPGFVQSGANFGLEQKHDLPQLTEIGSGTIVSDGLSVINARLSSTTFMVSRVCIGAHNYLGNNVFVPAGSRIGSNILLATKVAPPLEGPIRQNTGLLGSPCFEIPRTVLRDRQFDHLKSGLLFASRLRAKYLSNALAIFIYLATRWIYSYLLLVVVGVVITYYAALEYFLIPAIAIVVPFMTAGYFMLVERASMSFERLQPRLCSMYDPYYWRHERYWKLNASPSLAAFAGSPLMGVIWRLLGVRVGAKFFDDGCTIPERSLVTIGDHCTLNRASVLQGHSQEDGTFKSDCIEIGSGATIGCGTFVHYGTQIGEKAYVKADSFLMKGEVVPAGSVWVGNPARQQA